MWAWINGRLSSLANSRISVVDHGFTVGDGVFETLKTQDGRAIALTRHLRRLNRSASGLGLPAVDEDYVRGAVGEALAADPFPLGVMRITYTSGPGPMGSARGDEGCTLAVVSMPAKPWPATSKVAVSEWPRNERSPLAGLKTTSYAENALCLAQAKRQGADEAILANLQGNLCEGTGSNIFLVKDGEVVTPPLDDGCLAGVTRGLVLDWFDVRERSVPVSALESADEIFLTSCTRDVHPVQWVAEHQFAAPGPVTKRIASDFAIRIQDDPDPL